MMGLFLFEELQNGLSYFAELRVNGADEIVAPYGPKRASHWSSLTLLFAEYPFKLVFRLRFKGAWFRRV